MNTKGTPRYLILFVAVLAVVALLGTARTSTAVAGALIDPCLLTPADATLSLGSGVPAVLASHAGGYVNDPSSYGYVQRPCRALRRGCRGAFEFERRRIPTGLLDLRTVQQEFNRSQLV